jgi:preprotein translocase subunit YajC
LAINAPTIVINGTGYSNTAANNTVTFNNGAVGTVTTATSTQLTVTFTTLPSALGTLSASIVSNGITSGNPVGTLVQVATIVPAPTVSFSNANIASVVPFITILGTGFNGTTPSGNTVVFSNGAVGTVTAATSTQLTVTFSTAPTGTGILTAIVTTNSISSGAAVQVANIVVAPTITSTSTNYLAILDIIIT